MGHLSKLMPQNPKTSGSAYQLSTEAPHRPLGALAGYPADVAIFIAFNHM